MSWDAPARATDRDYRLNWAPVDSEFPTWTDASGNAFPTGTSYTITGLQAGARYKVRVRVRYQGDSPGPWHDIVEADVAGD